MYQFSNMFQVSECSFFPPRQPFSIGFPHPIPPLKNIQFVHSLESNSLFCTAFRSFRFQFPKSKNGDHYVLLIFLRTKRKEPFLADEDRPMISQTIPHPLCLRFPADDRWTCRETVCRVTDRHYEHDREDLATNPQQQGPRKQQVSQCDARNCHDGCLEPTGFGEDVAREVKNGPRPCALLSVSRRRIPRSPGKGSTRDLSTVLQLEEISEQPPSDTVFSVTSNDA